MLGSSHFNLLQSGDPIPKNHMHVGKRWDAIKASVEPGYPIP